MKFSDSLSLRARLYLASGAILFLFAFNVGTHLWAHTLEARVSWPTAMQQPRPRW